jgi:HAD superfamily hydrolase (TIGR01509 family)
MLPQALILDLDGTLADTEPLHDHAWDAVLHDFPPDAVEGQREKWIGMSSAEIARGLISVFPLRQSVEGVLRRKRRRFRQLVRKGLKPFSGLPEELARWMAAGVPLAVATSGSRREALLVLRKLGLPVRFEAVVTCDDVNSAKPAPDCYLLAAELLGKHPKDCSAIEDSINGMTAAVAAGMRVLAVSASSVESLPAGVERVFPSTVAALGWLRNGWTTG